jgi:anti-sigma-K factor RskA
MAMPEECQTIQPLLAAYALGSLEAEGRQQVEQHAGECPACRDLLADYQTIAAGLLQAVPGVTPSRAIRARLSDLVGAERRPSLPARREAVVRWGLGLALVCLVALNLLGLAQLAQLKQAQTQLQQAMGQDQVAQAIAAYPAARSVLVEGQSAYGTIVFDPERPVAAVYTWGLTPLPEAQTYQIWLRTADGGRVSGGTFQSAAEKGFTLVVVRAAQPMGTYSGVGVTIEPAGGSDSPTGASVLGGDF